MDIIVTGAVGIGKTTVCEKVMKMARSEGYSCGGVVAHKTRNEDIIIEDVQTGETKDLASVSNIYRGPRTGKYSFNPEGIEFGIRAIDRGIASDILLVDELGHLELRGEGFVKVIEHITAGKVKNCIMVIRKELLSAFLPRLRGTASIFETTIHNRNQLPGEIGLALAGAATAKYYEDH